MKWAKKKIELKDIPKFCSDYVQIIRKGVDVSNLRCVFKLRDNITIYSYTLLDFLNYYSVPEIQGTIEKLYFYQPFNKS